jgi:hypothetical protein
MAFNLKEMFEALLLNLGFLGGMIQEWMWHLT